MRLDWETPGRRGHIITGWVWEDAEAGRFSTRNSRELLSTRKPREGNEMARKSVSACEGMCWVSRWCKLAADKDGDLLHHHQKEWLFSYTATLWSPSLCLHPFFFSWSPIFTLALICIFMFPTFVVQKALISANECQILERGIFSGMRQPFSGENLQCKCG